MKRIICAILGLCLLFSGCAAAPTADSRVKLGLGADASYSISKDGVLTVETTWAAVVLDAGDRILSCKIDSIKSDIPQGDESVAFITKYDLKENYGMVAYGPAEKEWYEQIDIFCEAVCGKTLEEIMDLQSGEGDLSAGCTISVLPYQYAVAKACQNAVMVDAAEADTLSVKLQGTASSDNEFEFSFAAVTTADTKVTACRYDAVQVKVPLTNGEFPKGESDGGFKTKRELGYDYGMINYAGSDYEWFQQIDALEAAAVGKTAADIAGIAGEDGKVAPDNVDLASKATIYVGGIVGQIAAAAKA